MVKRLPNWLKIGLQSQFGPNFVVEFEAFSREKLAWPTTHTVPIKKNEKEDYKKVPKP